MAMDTQEYGKFSIRAASHQCGSGFASSVTVVWWTGDKVQSKIVRAPMPENGFETPKEARAEGIRHAKARIDNGDIYQD
jgi:hypothetical protein